MPGGARQPTLLRPASVAVHDYGDVARFLPRIQACQIVPGSAGRLFLRGFQGSDLQEFGFFIREEPVDALYIIVGEVLEYGLGPVLIVL